MTNANYSSSLQASDRLTSCSDYSSSDAEASTPRIRIFDRFSKSPETEEASISSTSPSPEKGPLPEFAGSGFGTGIFGPPVRGPVHPSRPPSLEIRPHLTRESQVGRFLRNITCVSGGGEKKGPELWAGSECGVRVWDLGEDLYGREDTGGEYGTVRYLESARVGSSALCLVGCGGNGVVWSGHSDGKIRCWKMRRNKANSARGKENASGGFREVVAWQAHQGPVFSMVVSSYGDIWSGSEAGSIKIWPWEAMEKSLALANEQRHLAAVMVERSYIDLRRQVAVNGACCSIFTSDVRFMLSDHAGAKVWSASYHSFALWDARTKELLKVLSINGQIENVSFDPITEEETKLALASASKEKTQNSFSFFQRSRNAILGAADAVRRAATKGACAEDNRRIEALVSTPDGSIWMGFANGSLVQWDGNGSQIQEVQYCPFSAQSLCTVGSRIWVGYANGALQVLNLNGDLLGEWVGHSSPIIDLTVGSGYVFSLANHGGIRGWSVTSPGPINDILRTELACKEFSYTRIEKLKILVGTWNVGEGRASHDSLISWLGNAVTGIDVIVVGLQEVEMGAGFLAVSAAKETMGLDEGSSAGQWWLEMIGKTLDEGSTFSCAGSRQLAGLLISVWVRNKIQAHVGDVDVAAVPCGLGRAIGNKGAVGMRMRIYGRVVCFVNCHFAAHLEAVNRRNADFDHVYQTMAFTRPPNLLNASPATQNIRYANGTVTNSIEGIPELSEADMVVFLGDFNYRLNEISYDQARDFISQRSFDWLREMDQLRAEMISGNAFQGMREAIIRFPPTYKFERYQPGLAGYDSGEKKRIPAWCDRILYRDSRSASLSTCSLHCPVVSSILRYDACMDVTDSDHKPVRCVFDVEVARVDESVRRRALRDIIRSNREVKKLLEEQYKVPEIIVSTNNIILQNEDVSILRITNKCKKDTAVFEIICEGVSNINEDGQASDHRPRGSFGFPQWLEVKPSRGIIEADHVVEVSIRHDEYQTLQEFVDGVPQNSWCEDARDKEVMLVIKVHGSCGATEEESFKSHRVCVRYSIATKLPPINRKPENPNPNRAGLLRRSDFKIDGSSCDVVHHLRNLYTP